jgi:hypothetical protein
VGDIAHVYAVADPLAELQSNEEPACSEARVTATEVSNVD